MPAWVMMLWSYRKLIAIGLLALTLFGAGYELRAKLDQADEAARLIAQAEAQKKSQAESDAKAAAWEQQLASLRAANKKLTWRLKNETTKAVYSSCIVPDDGVQIYNDALSGHSSGGSGGSVP